LFFAQIEGIREFEDFRTLLELFIEAEVDLNSADESGWTPLFYLLFYCFLDEPENAWGLSEVEIQAMADKKIALFNMFIEAGADVTTADRHGNTLLHYVVQAPFDSIDKGRFQIELVYDTRGIHRLFSRQLIELLIENGLSLTDENNDGETPLDWATQGGRGGMMGGMGGMGGGFGVPWGGMGGAGALGF
jgi:ankyrin repeat protein